MIRAAIFREVPGISEHAPKLRLGVFRNVRKRRGEVTAIPPTGVQDNLGVDSGAGMSRAGVAGRGADVRCVRGKDAQGRSLQKQIAAASGGVRQSVTTNCADPSMETADNRHATG
jgi:hypothetical protein